MKQQEFTDKELIQSYLAGNENSLETIIHKYKNRVYGYIMMIVKDPNLADDIFQDSFIKIINTLKAGNYKEEGKFLQWTMRIAHNLMIDHFRKAKRIPTVESSDDSFDIFDIIQLPEESIEEKMITEQIHADVKNLIQYLPEEQKEVLMMRHYSNMSFKDIAEQTNVSINTALGRMRYALINLRKLIKEKDLILTK